MLEAILGRKQGNALGVNTLLLMQADKGFADIANPNRVVQKSANPTIGSTQAKFNGLSFNCLAGGILIPADNKKDLVFPVAQSYTIEFWAYNTNLNGVWWLSSAQSAKSDLKVFNGNAYLQDEASGLSTPSSYMTTGKWTHIAISSVGGSKVRLFVDGKIIGVPFTPTGWSNLSYPLIVGSGEVHSNSYLDQIRISKIARYTDVFTPPTAPFVVD